MTTSPPASGSNKINPENDADLKDTRHPKVGPGEVSQDIEEIDKMNDSQVLKMGLLNNQNSGSKLDFEQI